MPTFPQYFHAGMYVYFCVYVYSFDFFPKEPEQN